MFRVFVIRTSPEVSASEKRNRGGSPEREQVNSVDAEEEVGGSRVLAHRRESYAVAASEEVVCAQLQRARRTNATGIEVEDGL